MSRTWRRLQANCLVIAGGLLVVLLVGLAIIGPLVTRDPLARDIDHGLTAVGAPLTPSADHLAGTDQLGRDVWARVIDGAGTSLAIAATATLIALVIGLAIGLCAGYASGWTDSVLMRLVDLVLSFPFLLLAILLARRRNRSWKVPSPTRRCATGTSPSSSRPRRSATWRPSGR